MIFSVDDTFDLCPCVIRDRNGVELMNVRRGNTDTGICRILPKSPTGEPHLRNDELVELIGYFAAPLIIEPCTEEGKAALKKYLQK